MILYTFMIPVYGRLVQAGKMTRDTIKIENDVLRILDDAIEVAKLLGITSVVIDRSLYSWPT